MNDPKITLSFTPARLDYIAQVLGTRPYAEVAALMGEIQAQISQQQNMPAPNGQDANTAGNPAH